MIRARLAASLASALVILSASALAAQQPGIDVLRYRFDITLPDTGARIEVVARVAYRQIQPTRELLLDLLAPMQVASATTGCDRRVSQAKAVHDGRRVRITVPAARSERDTSCVTLRYAGVPADGLVIGTDSAGRWRAFGDNWPDRARHWLASVDHPSDKAIVEFVVRAPAGRTVVTSASAHPLPTYLMVIAAAPLTETRLGETACGVATMARCVPQSVFTAPEQARYLPGNFAQAGAIVEFFGSIVAPYPYERLSHLQSSTRFGGMENAGAIFYADALFRRPEGVGLGLVAHEVAHQWFGDAVTPRAWPHVWLSEGFATYFAALYTEYAQGEAAFIAQLNGIRNQVTGAAVVAQRPVIDTAQTDLMQLLNTNSYQKGGYVLHMLRRELGDTAFIAGVREYYVAGVHNTALTSDLRLAMERASGRELNWFFDQWLRRPGFIEAEVGWRYDAATREILATVTQGTRFPPYRFKLPLEVEGADGTKRIVVVDVPASATSEVKVPVRFDAAPVAVRLDPRGDLLAILRAR
jgi:aminopeptidase N